MKSETYACDICGKQKGDVNHWWVGTATEIGSHRSFVVYPWPCGRGEVAVGKRVNHLCGQQCAIQAVSEWLQANTQGQGSLSALPESQETK